MTISLNAISQIFQGTPTANHGILIQKGKTYEVVSKRDARWKTKVPLHTLLRSILAESDQSPERALQITNYWVIRLKRKELPKAFRYVQAVINVFGRVCNWFNGTGYKTNLELALEVQTQLTQKAKPPEFPKGFVPVDFDESLAYGQNQPNDPAFTNHPDFQIVRKNFQAFCDQVKAKGEVDFSKPPENPSIPAKVHFIWLGPSVPKSVLSVRDSWAALHPGWEVKIWRDADIEAFPWEPKQRATFDQALKDKCWAEAADVWRLNILYQQGGIYADADYVCYKPFHQLISSEMTFFAGQEINRIQPWEGNREPLFLCNALIGAEKGSPLLRRYMDTLVPRSDSKYPLRPIKDILSRTGPICLSRACREALQGPQSSRVLILPCSYIYPLPPDGKAKRMSKEDIETHYRPPEAQGVHLWDGSWM